MTSDMELVPLTPQKRDPAWKHCQMFKSEDKLYLKCIHCFKIFKGGGIHRIKAHLACLKGNAATCLRVPVEVRLEMQQSLINSSGSSCKRRKKQGTSEETEKFNSMLREIELLPASNQSDVNDTLQDMGSPFTAEPISSLGVDGMINHGRDKRRKDGVGLTSPDGNIDDVSGLAEVKVNEHLHMAIGRFLYDIGAPLDAVNSVYFQPMVEAIVAAGSRAVQPSRHDLCGSVLKNSLHEVKDEIQKITSTWSKTGCSVIVNQLTEMAGRIFLSVLVHCPEGTVFFKSIEASSITNSSEDLYEFLKQVVEEVGESLVQVITNGEEQYIAAGRKLADSFPNLYWSPCAAQSVDLILEDFAKMDWINTTIEQAKSITQFVYNHSGVLNMLRRFIGGNDIVEPGFTRVSTSFQTIKKFVDLKSNLQSMVSSDEWMECPSSKETGGVQMLDIISNQSFWSSCDLIVRLTNPLLRALRIIRSVKRPSLGYIYATMYKAKEAIKKEFDKRDDYLPYWNIIDQCWGPQWRNPLHAAGFYLNPKFFYSIEGDMPNEIVSGMFDCIERLVPDTNVQDKIIKEINSYKNAVGDFSRKMAIRARDTLLPAEWWSTYGGSCPNLTRLAIRVLGQTCGSTGYRQISTPFGQIHDTRNSLERQRVNDLVFVHNNLRMGQMYDNYRERNSVDPISFDCNSLVEDWIVCTEDFGSSDWMTLEQPYVSPMQLVADNDEVEDLGTGFDDLEIFNRVEEENVI